MSKKLTVKHLVLDSADRNIDLYPDIGDFVLKMNEPFKNVVAIRLVKTEYYTNDINGVNVMINNTTVPLYLTTIAGLYVYLNNYKMIHRSAEIENTNMFARITTGTESYPYTSSSLLRDPYVYLLKPYEPKLDRFHIQLYYSDNTRVVDDPECPEVEINFVITIAVFCIEYENIQ